MSVTAAMSAAGICRPTTDRSAMTISLYIAPSIIVATEKVDIRSRISAVVTSVITVASITAIHVTHTSRQKNRENKRKSVIKFHGRNLNQMGEPL
jgi:hypothetical protein